MVSAYELGGMAGQLFFFLIAPIFVGYYIWKHYADKKRNKNLTENYKKE